MHRRVTDIRLEQRQVDVGPWWLSEPRVFQIADHADDCSPIAASHLHPASERRFGRLPDATGERLIDDHYARRHGRVSPLEITAGHERNMERTEVTLAHDVVEERELLVGPWGVVLDRDAAGRRVDEAERRVPRQRDAINTWQGAYRVEERREK